jgi:serine/threonine protein kinase
MIGATLGSYRIVSEIGSGGMGVVYLAEHTLLGRKAAVKLLRAELPQEYVERFFNEAKAAATLRHAGLVDVFDFGHHTDGSAYIVMEFLEGESLAERLEREPRLPVPLALSIARSVANALFVAHEQGIIHRDLKPGNIFLVPDDEASMGLRTKVLDFGIAKLQRDRDDSRSVKTQSGAVIGTPRYMSPEQCKNAKSADARSDIYGLGCILYEMLLGVAPFDYDTWAELVGAHIYEVPAKPSEIDARISKDVEILVQKMLEKSPDARFATMQELAQSLEVLLLQHGERVRLTPPTLARPSLKKIDDLDGHTATALDATGAFEDTVMKKAEAPTLTPSEDAAASKALEEAKAAAEAKAEAKAAEAKAAEAKAAVKRQSQALRAASEIESSAAAESTIKTQPVAKTAKMSWPTLALGAAGLVLLSVAGAVYMTKNKQAQSETAFIVVDERGSDGSAAHKPVDDAVTVDAGAAVVEPAVDAGTPAAGSAKPRVPPTETDVGALTRTFGKQSPAITACFKQHGETTEKVSIRIQIDKQGAVQATQVLPESVAASPLGECVAGVAKKTSFGPQPKGATFRVPLLTSGH